MPTNDQGMTRRPRGRPKKVYPYHLMQAQGQERSQQELPPLPAADVAANLASAFEELIKAVRHPAGGVPPGATGGHGPVVSDRAPGEPHRLLVGVKVAAAMLGVGVGTINALIYRGELISVRVAKRRLIPVSAVEAFVQKQVEASEEAIARGMVPGL